MLLASRRCLPGLHTTPEKTPWFKHIRDSDVQPFSDPDRGTSLNVRISNAKNKPLFFKNPVLGFALKSGPEALRASLPSDVRHTAPRVGQTCPNKQQIAEAIDVVHKNRAHGRGLLRRDNAALSTPADGAREV